MKRGRICVSASFPDADAVGHAVLPIEEFVDVVEIRLDAMAEPEVEKCLHLFQLPLLFTNRPTWEGGDFSGTEQARLAPLLLAMRLQAAYVDLEFRTEKQLREELLDRIQQSSTRLILSWHDFESTPTAAELTDTMVQMQATGADIGKIVTTARTPEDVLRVLALQEKARELQFPLISFCMGDAGRISRFATLYLDGFMTYVAPAEEQATAPGQFSALHFQQLRTLFDHGN
jgi:3-dehydroquinate dehydratase-1/3-dehydroquinate dehydratase/shikimate dehydrogenase